MEYNVIIMPAWPLGSAIESFLNLGVFVVISKLR